MLVRWLSTVLAAAALSLGAGASADQRIGKIQVQDLPDRVVITVRGTEELRFDARMYRNLLKAPSALTADFRGAIVPGGAGRARIMGGAVWMVRYGMFRSKPAPVVRVVVSSRQATPCRIYRSGDGTEVSLEVAKAVTGPVGSAESPQDGWTLVKTLGPEAAAAITPAGAALSPGASRAVVPPRLVPAALKPGSRSTTPASGSPPGAARVGMSGVTPRQDARLMAQKVAARPKHIELGRSSAMGPAKVLPLTGKLAGRRVAPGKPVARVETSSTRLEVKDAAAPAQDLPRPPRVVLVTPKDAGRSPAPTRAAAVPPVSVTAAEVTKQAPGTLPRMWLRSQEKDLPVVSGLVAAKSQAVRRQGTPVAQAAGGGADAAAPPTVRLDVDRSEVSDVLALIIEQTGANIVYRPEEVVGAISVRLRDASVEQSLEAVTRAAGLAYRKEGGTYYVGKPETIQAMFPVPTTNQVYTLKQALVADLTPILTRLFPPDTGLNVMSQGTHLLVLTGPTEVVNQAMAMLPELDVPKVEVVVNPEEVETSVVQELKYLSQDNAAQVITQVIPGSAIAASTDEGTTPGTAAAPAKLRIVKIPGPTLPVGASSGTSGTGSTSLLGTQPSAISTSSSGTSSTGSSVGNAYKLLLLGQKGLVNQAVALLERVDVPLRQLRIEARVLDINRTKTSDHGFAWQIGQNLSFKEVLPSPVAGATTANPFRIGSFERTTPLAVDVAISAMVSDNKARVLAEPSIRVLDGVQGQIFIGDVLRFVVSQQSTPTGNVVQIGETNVGIGLNVVGRSSSDGYITLNLSPTVSIALTGQEGLPQTRSRSVSTTVRVKDGETIVIGGLFSEQDVDNASKVPILGDLPVLGSFFRSRNKNKVNSEVVIFLKTQILPADERAVAELRQ